MCGDRMETTTATLPLEPVVEVSRCIADVPAECLCHARTQRPPFNSNSNITPRPPRSPPRNDELNGRTCRSLVGCRVATLSLAERRSCHQRTLNLRLLRFLRLLLLSMSGDRLSPGEKMASLACDINRVTPDASAQSKRQQYEMDVVPSVQEMVIIWISGRPICVERSDFVSPSSAGSNDSRSGSMALRSRMTWERVRSRTAQGGH
ncbi:hypothetical protein BD309DRAFT_661602 [Dichomitus squalens]|nr:hypothetical protein BD309DRAFT_661602 [Dichomitus squalens]